MDYIIDYSFFGFTLHFQNFQNNIIVQDNALFEVSDERQL